MKKVASHYKSFQVITCTVDCLVMCCSDANLAGSTYTIGKVGCGRSYRPISYITEQLQNYTCVCVYLCNSMNIYTYIKEIRDKLSNFI